MTILPASHGTATTATRSGPGGRFQLIDTGGLDTDAEGGLEESVQKQSRLALREADVILFLFDGKGGLNPLDREAVGLLRKEDKPVLFAVNKLDSRQRADNLYEFYALGIDPLFSISAEHGLGISDLMDEVVQQFPNVEENEADRGKRCRSVFPSSAGPMWANRL